MDVFEQEINLKFMKGKNSQEVAALPMNLPARQNSIAKEPSVKQKKSGKRRPMTTKVGKKPKKKEGRNNLSQSSLLISDNQQRKEQLKSTDSHQLMQQMIYPKLSENKNVSQTTMHAVHKRMESTQVLGSGALIGFEGITTLQKLKQNSHDRARSAHYHTCQNAGASHVSRNFLIQQPNLTSSAGGFKSSRMVKIQQAREEKPAVQPKSKLVPAAPQIKVLEGPQDQLQTKYRLPSLSKCLENQILPKNSQKLKRIYSIASKQGGSESQFNRLLQNELKRRKNFTPTQAILSSQISGAELPPPDIQSNISDKDSVPSPKAVKIQNIELPCACPTPIVPNRHILLSRFVGQRTPKNQQKRGSNDDVLVGTDQNDRSSFITRNMMIIGQKRDLQVRKNSSSTSPKNYNTELTAVLLDQSQVNAVSTQILPAAFEFSKNNSSQPEPQPAPRRKIDLKVQQENQSGENVSSVVGDQQSQNNSQAMVIYYEYFDPDTGQRYLIQNLSQSTAMPPMKMHQQYNTAVVQPPVELLSPLVAAEQNTLPHETTEKRLKSNESLDDFPDLKQITRIDYQIKQVKDPKLPIPISQFDFKGPHTQKGIKMPGASLFDRVKKKRGSNKSKKTPVNSQEKIPRLALNQEISCGADTLVGASGAFHAIKNNAVLDHIVNKQISGDEVPGLRDLNNQSPSAKDMATQLILSQSMADQSGLTKQGDRSETPSIVKSREHKPPSRFVLTHSKKTLDNATTTKKITYSPGPREHTPVPESRQEVLLDKDDLHTQQSNLTEDDSQKVVNSIYNQFDETKFSGENVESVRGHTPLQQQHIGSESIEDNDSSLTLEKQDKGEMEPIKPYCFAFDVNDRQSISHRDHLSKSKNSKKSRTGSPMKGPDSEKREINLPEDSNGSEDSSQGVREISPHSDEKDLGSKLPNQDGTQSPEYHKHTMFAVSRGTDGQAAKSAVHFQTQGIQKLHSLRSSSNLAGRYTQQTTTHNQLKGKKVKLGKSDQRNESAQVKRRRVQSAHPDRGPCKHKILQQYDKKEVPKKQSRHIFIYQQEQSQPNDRYRQSGGTGQKNDGVLSFGNSDYLQEGHSKNRGDNPAQFSFNRKPLITSKESVQQSESSANYSPPPPLQPIQKNSTASLLHVDQVTVKEYLLPPDGKIKELQTLSADENIADRPHSDTATLPGNRPRSGKVPKLNQIHEIVQKVEIAEKSRPHIITEHTEASFRNRKQHAVSQIKEETSPSKGTSEDRALTPINLPKRLLQSTQGHVIEEEGEDSPSVAGKGEVTSADREVEFVFSRQNQLSPHMNEIEQLLQWQQNQPVLFEQGVQMGMMAAVQKLMSAHDHETHIQKISILKRLQEELSKKESDRTSFFADLVKQYTESRLLKQEAESIQIQGAKLLEREKVAAGDKMYSTLKKYRRRRRFQASSDLLCVQNRRHPPQGKTRLFSPMQPTAQEKHQSIAALIHHAKLQKTYQSPSQFLVNQTQKQESNEKACLPASLPAMQPPVQISAFQNRVNSLAKNAEANRRRMVTNTEEGLVNIQGVGIQDERVSEDVRQQRNMFAAKVLLDKGRTLKMDTNQVSKKLLHIIGDKMDPDEIERELLAMNVSKKDIAQFEREMASRQPQHSPAKVNFDLIQRHYPAPIQHVVNPMLAQKSFRSSNMDALQSANLMRSQNATQLMSTFIKDGNSHSSKLVTPNLLGRSDLSMRTDKNISESTYLPMSGIKQITQLKQVARQNSIKQSPVVKMGGVLQNQKAAAEPPSRPQTTKNKRVTNTFDFEQQKRQTQRWLINEPSKKTSGDLSQSYQVAPDQGEMFRQIMSQAQMMRDMQSKQRNAPQQHFIKVQRTHTEVNERSELVRQTQELLQNPQFQSEASARFAPSLNPPQSTVEVGLEIDLVQVESSLNPNI